ncbi:hypothetical protein [Brevibacillus composti]|nr:hypothetical protein [Brevibacillus composti]
MGTIAAKAKGKTKKNPSSRVMLAEAIHRIAEENSASNEQVMREMQQVRRDIEEMKETISRIKVKQPSRSRGGVLFGRRRSIPVELEPPKPKPALPLEDLLPLLPQLGAVIPQLKNPKVAESVKVLSNPAVIAMIQQFLANGGLRGRSAAPVSRRDGRMIG